MVADRADELFHRFDLASHRTDAPVMQKTACPVWAFVLPKSLELFLHQVRPNRSQVVTQQFLQRMALPFALLRKGIQGVTFFGTRPEKNWS